MEHLEGKNHKKKEAVAKNAVSQGGTSTAVARNSKHLYCELCDVVCTCADTFAAHLRGTKHNKVTSHLWLPLSPALHSVFAFTVFPDLYMHYCPVPTFVCLCAKCVTGILHIYEC